MKKFVMLLVGAFSMHACIAENETSTAQLANEKPKNSVWQRILRPPFKTLAIMTDITTAGCIVWTLFAGAEYIVVTDDRLAKDNLLASVVHLFLSYGINVFSRAALAELS